MILYTEQIEAQDKDKWKSSVCVSASIEEVECRMYSVYVRQKTHTFGTNKSNQKFSSSVSLMGQTISNEWLMLRTPYRSGVWCLCVRKKMNGYVLLWWTIDKYHNRNLHIAIIWKKNFFPHSQHALNGTYAHTMWQNMWIVWWFDVLMMWFDENMCVCESLTNTRSFDCS